MRITGVGAPAAAATPPSLSDITAGTLQVPLNMVVTNTVTAGNTQLVGTTRGLEGNAVAGKAVYFGIGAVDHIYASELTSGFLCGNAGVVYAYAASDPTENSTVGAAGFMALGYNKTNHPNLGANGAGGLYFTTRANGAAGKFYWSDGQPYNPPLMMLDPLSSNGLYLYNLGGFKGNLKPSALTADRTFTLPDASGTLMVSGGSGSVPLSSLTAGTIIPGLIFDYGTTSGTATITTNKSQIGLTSGGFAYNCKSGQTHVFSVNGTNSWQIANNLSTIRGNIAFSNQVAVSGNVVGQNGDTYMALNGTVGSGLATGGVYGIYTDGVQTYLGLPLNLYSAIADPASTFVYANSSDGVSAAYNVASGGAHNKKVAGTTKFSVNGSNCVFADPPKFSTALGAVTGGSGIPTLPALGTGGTGQPTTAGQNGWLKAVNSAGTTIYIPVWV